MLSSVRATRIEADLFVLEADPHAVQCGPALDPLGFTTVPKPVCETPPCESMYTQQMAAGFLTPPHWSIRFARCDWTGCAY